MRRRTILKFLLAPCGLGGGLGLLGGCGGDSKTSGTQLQISPEVKSAMDEMRSSMKEQRESRKPARPTRKKGK